MFDSIIMINHKLRNGIISSSLISYRKSSSLISYRKSSLYSYKYDIALYLKYVIFIYFQVKSSIYLLSSTKNMKYTEIF